LVQEGIYLYKNNKRITLMMYVYKASNNLISYIKFFSICWNCKKLWCTILFYLIILWSIPRIVIHIRYYDLCYKHFFHKRQMLMNKLYTCNVCLDVLMHKHLLNRHSFGTSFNHILNINCKTKFIAVLYKKKQWFHIQL